MSLSPGSAPPVNLRAWLGLKAKANNTASVLAVHRQGKMDFLLILLDPLYSAQIKFTLLNEYVTILQKPQAHNVRYLL